MGSLQTQVKRFRVNPIEVAIFAVVTMIFLNSVYNLFYDTQSISQSAVQPGMPQTTLASSDGSAGQEAAPGGTSADSSSTERVPSSTTLKSAFINLEISCDAKISKETSANKVRILGKFCAEDPVKTVVVNKSNHDFAATVFPDVTSNKFSTDYIPLVVGENTVHVEFLSSQGTAFAQDVVILKK